MEASFEMHSMFLEATGEVIKDARLLDLFNIPSSLWPAIRHSWTVNQRDFLGRFDWSWNGDD